MAELMRYVQIEENGRRYWGARYEAAYAQIGIRITARENMLIGYIAAAATLIGIAFSSPELRRIALVVPYMAAAVALVLLNHETVIGQLEEYLAEMCRTMNIRGDWYDRENLGEDRLRGLGYRTLALVAVISGSSAVAVWIGMDVARSNIIVWCGDIVAAAWAFFFTLHPRIRRIRQYRAWIRTQRTVTTH